MLLSFEQLKELIKTALDRSESRLLSVRLPSQVISGMDEGPWFMASGLLRPSEFHPLWPSQQVPEGEQAAGCFRHTTCMPDAHGPGSAWLWTLWYPF